MTNKASGKSNAHELVDKEIKALEQKEAEVNKEINNKKADLKRYEDEQKEG